MNEDQLKKAQRAAELKKYGLIETTAKAVAEGVRLIDVQVDQNPLYFCPHLSDLPEEIVQHESEILDRAVLLYTKRATLRMAAGDFVENILNGNVRQLKKDIKRHAVDPQYDANGEITSFKIRLKDLSSLELMKVL
jgi:hypothetical protein